GRRSSSMGASGRASRSGIEQGIELALQLAQCARQFAVAAFGLVAQLLQFMREVERGQYRDAVDRRHAVGAAYLAHTGIEQLRRGYQSVALAGLDADGVLAVEDADAGRFAAAHVCCSSDLSRAIMASTRERACSFLASSWARSPASCSCCWRRLRFSSASRRVRSASASKRALSARSCSITSGLSMSAR